MSKKLKHILSVFILLVFIMPTTIKLLDDAFHHHLRYKVLPGHEQAWILYHRACPIPGFTLSFFNLQKQIVNTEKPHYCGELPILFSQQYFSFLANPAILLRAPPFSGLSKPA